MKNAITVAGNLTVDIIKYIDHYPACQALTDITGIDRATGGLCCNVALTLAKLAPELPIRVIGLLGDDEAGDYIMTQFTAHPSIDTAGLRRLGATSYTDVMTEKDTGKRTFFHYRGANALLDAAHFDFERMETDILHIGYILLLDSLDVPDPAGIYPSAMCGLLAKAQSFGIRTSIDVVSAEGGRYSELVPPALRFTDYCCINEYEAAAITGIKLRDGAGAVLRAHLRPACHALMEMGVAHWAVIHMPELSCGLARDGDYVELPSWKLTPGFLKSSVGAGDAFAAGVLYGAYHEKSLAKSLRIAGAIAAYSLSGAGASDAVIPLPELLTRMEAFQAL